ncbi:thioredoxin reductase [Campylobacter sp. CCUG 57310]|uniref:thioredoxin reductase n=1 Tax=Campylobacter sp. CCUG 57310 TaxID=2517362 RepID=UPI0020B1441C|nr:thioredoxin reductase [Campylobacter sp. CCUG 57310]QKF91451.1 hypothetical protein CORI_0216 [Campylobacter sp. CCUG 57310]
MNSNETYNIKTMDGTYVTFDKRTNLLIPNNKDYKKPRTNQEYLKIHSKFLLDSRAILDSSAYINYKPNYYNPKPDSYGQTDYLSFQAWLDMSYKRPQKGSIAPWTKKEKAYYESLKDKRERFIYLIKRSNLKCTMIEIPEDAMLRVDSKGVLTKPEYEDIYDRVSANVDSLKSRLFSGEWRICAGMLGDKRSFARATILNYSGFKTRARQAVFLSAQLGEVDALKVLARYFSSSSTTSGSQKDLIRSKELELIYNNPPLDEYGMIPYLDEIIGVDWIMDFNRGGLALDPGGDIMRYLRELVEEKGELLDPRDMDADERSREEFINYAKEKLIEELEFFASGFPDSWNENQINLYIDSTLLESKVISLTPPEGYPNAPYYNTPEELKRMYEAGTLDKKLNPTIPAMYREYFPKDLKEKIEDYALRHNIRD